MVIGSKETADLKTHGAKVLQCAIWVGLGDLKHAAKLFEHK